MPPARARADEALELCARHDHPEGRGRLLAVSAQLAARAGDHATARRQFEASLRLAREAHDQQGLAYAHLLAGHAALDRSDRADAAEHFAGVLTIARETHDQPALARGLEGVARLLAPAQPQRALSLVAAAGALRQALGFHLTPLDRARLQSWVPGAGAALGSAAELVHGDVPAEPVATALAEALEGCAWVAARA
jgi:tetratricopeptide (TPR) repeat protein